MVDVKLVPDDLRSEILGAVRHAVKAGAAFVPVSSIDGYLERRSPGIFLKHDVHNVSPMKLIEFARREADMGVFGTYFFMSFGHPRGQRFFSPGDQCMMMREVADMGHEVGAHFDLFYDLRQRRMSVRHALLEMIESFAKIIGDVRVFNLHGNSRQKMTDVDGNNLIYEFFDELARHPDYPDLRNVPEEFAGTIRQERISLSSLDVSYWGDSWIWSRTNGMIATNLVSDNWMGKQQEMAVTINVPEACAYGLNPPVQTGIRDGRQEATWLRTGRSFPANFFQNRFRLRVESDDFTRFFSDALPTAPFVMLLHPEFYAA